MDKIYSLLSPMQKNSEMQIHRIEITQAYNVYHASRTTIVYSAAWTTIVYSASRTTIVYSVSRATIV